MITIAEQLNVKDFPFTIKNSKGKDIYYEDSEGYWCKWEYNSKGIQIYYENSNGLIEDDREIPEYTMEELVEKIGNFKLKQLQS